jgi:hypothetical protein
MMAPFVTTVILDHIVTTETLSNIAASLIIVAFILLVVLMTS